MFNTGLALQLEQKSNVLHNAHLLIVTDSSSCLDEIKQVLQAMTVKFRYHTVTCDRSIEALSQHQYDLILYNYSKYQNDFDKTEANSVLEQSETVEHLEALNGHNKPYPIPELAWWYQLSTKIPLILITEPLGDEIAIACVRSGIDAYLLKNKIASLPQIIEQTLSNFIAEQFYNSRQTQLKQELITAENNSDRKECAALRDREYFSHLNHELRSPLASILQFAKMLKEEIYGSLNPKQTEYIAGILTSGNHLLELINNYLDMAKIDANREELYREKVPVEDICEASLVMVKGKAREKGLELILDLAENIDFCYADSLRLKQILINLLSNAVKFTEQGSITLQVRKNSKILYFSIIDTGIGISKEDSVKLFKPFQQVNTHLHRKYKGTGLGLALSRKLAQLHGGDITLYSEVGKGSRFTVSIPQETLSK
jgi:signal transduction histidine kinase